MRAEAQTKPPFRTMNAALHRPIKKAPTAANADPAMEFAAGTFKPWDIVTAPHPGYPDLKFRPCVVIRRINLDWRERPDAEKFIKAAAPYFNFADEADEIVYPYDKNQEGYWLLPLSTKGWDEVFVPEGPEIANLHNDGSPQFITRNLPRQAAGYHLSAFPCNAYKIRVAEGAFSSQAFKALILEGVRNQMFNGFISHDGLRCEVKELWLDARVVGTSVNAYTSLLPFKLLHSLEDFNPSGCGEVIADLRSSGKVDLKHAGDCAVASMTRRGIEKRIRLRTHSAVHQPRRYKYVFFSGFGARINAFLAGGFEPPTLNAGG